MLLCKIIKAMKSFYFFRPLYGIVNEYLWFQITFLDHIETAPRRNKCSEKGSVRTSSLTFCLYSTRLPFHIHVLIHRLKSSAFETVYKIIWFRKLYQNESSHLHKCIRKRRHFIFFGQNEIQITYLCLSLQGFILCV